MNPSDSEILFMYQDAPLIFLIQWALKATATWNKLNIKKALFIYLL